MTTQAASCRVVVINDVLDSRTELDTPQTAEEAMRNHGLVKSANDWIAWHGTGDGLLLDGTYQDTPVACSVRHTDDLVTVHWHIVGDPESARDAMRTILDGTWKRGELL